MDPGKKVPGKKSISGKMIPVKKNPRKNSLRCACLTVWCMQDRGVSVEHLWWDQSIKIKKLFNFPQ